MEKVLLIRDKNLSKGKKYWRRWNKRVAKKLIMKELENEEKDQIFENKCN